MTKLVFLDIDGTLVSFDTHRIPPSSVSAIKAAHDRGVKIIIATGRCKRLINNLSEIEPYISGYCCTNGAFTIVDDREVSFFPIAPADVETIIEKANQEKIPCIISGKHNVTCINRNELFHKVFVEMHDMPYFAGSLPSLESVLAEGITEITAFFTNDKEESLMRSLGNCESSRWYPAFMDITAKGVNKGRALREVAASLGFTIEKTMAIGDGDNDVSMIQAAGIGVAMGNSTDDVKSKADFITDHIDNDGLQKAFKHFGIC